MKFIHTADIHWGAHPDSGKPWGKERKRALKDSFIELIAIIKKEKTELLIIAGNLFHNQPLLRDLKEMSFLFSTIPDTRVVFTAGNHDFLKDSSHYHIFTWPENVYFLASEDLESIYFSDWNLEIHGFSYYHATRNKDIFAELTHEHDERRHFLILHGGDENHVPFTATELRGLNFDYIALGHIHKPSILIPNRAAYPGSLEPINSTEFGHHGYIEGELSESGVSIKQIAFAKTRYISLIVHVTPDTTNTELNQILTNEIKKRGLNHIYRFKIQGFYDPDTVFDFTDLHNDYRITEILNESEPRYDYETLYKEHPTDMIGLYIASFDKPDMSAVEKKALFYGMKALMNTTNEGK